MLKIIFFHFVDILNFIIIICRFSGIVDEV